MDAEPGERANADVSGVVHAIVPTVLGELLLVADDSALVGLYFPGHRYPPRAEATGSLVAAAEHPILAAAAAQLNHYLAGRARAFDLPLAPRGDEFSQSVWALLREIPRGETTTYGALAARLGNRHLAQRVGQAVGHNPISIVIPCHRVLGADGSLTGFAGGLERKAFLLELEEPAERAAERLF